MDKKKLIGTIVGVTAFIALIAGATFAWFTATVGITTGTYNAKTLNFVINYTKGTDITTMPPMLKNSAATGGNTSTLVVAANRTSNDADGKLEIRLTTTSSNTLTTSGALHYAVCTGTETASACTGALTSGSTGVQGTPGNVTAAGTKTIFTVNTIPTTKTYYWVHFWLDGDVVTNAHANQAYAGYIHAYAQQS